MSANNSLVIIKTKKGKFLLRHRDLDCGWHKDKWPQFETLEEAVKAANKFQEEREVEYGLQILL